MTTLRSPLSALLLAACLGTTLAACGDDNADTAKSDSGAKTESTETQAEATEAPKTNEYPKEITDEYTKSCVPSAVSSSNGKLNEETAATVCQNTLECIQKELTSDEFIAVSTKMMSGDENPDAKIFTDCATEAGEAFTK